MSLQKCILQLLAIVAIISYAAADKPCAARKYNHSSIVCVCNAEYCDEISKIQPLPQGEYNVYSSDMEGLRFSKSSGSFQKMNGKTKFKPFSLIDLLKTITKGFRAPGDTTLKIDRSKTYQSIFGFGGSFTDAAGINLKQLSEETQKNFVKSYYSEDGLEYNVGRVPIGGCDFSTHPYAYNMYPENDAALSNFSLTIEDYELKIPLIKAAREAATDELLLISSAWSPPVWMKTNKAFGGVSRLLEEYYQTWADYHLRFLEEYDKNDVKFWAITTGNEPSNGVIPLIPFNTLGWMPQEQSKWLVNNLGPNIRNSKFADMKIIALDDQRFSLPWWIEFMTANEDALQYIDGIGTHWYWDDIVPPRPIERTHAAFPDKFFISTEACVGDKPWQTEKVELGSWERGELYVFDILETLNHWYSGWVDWNLALDRIGGPNWFNNHVDSPVIVLPENDEFVKQPLYFAMGHFSKFIPRNSKRVDVEVVGDDIHNVAFLRPDGGIAIVFNNPTTSTRTVTIQEEGVGFIDITISPHSLHSLVYW